MPAARNKNAAKARLKRCSATFPKLLEDYEQDHPEWRFEVPYWLLKWGLKSLQCYLASSEKSGISWASPYVEIRFPVDCIWSETSTAQQPSFTLQSGRLSIANMKDEKAADKALSRLLIRHLEIVALQEWTNRSSFEQRGDKLQPILSAAQIEELDKISDPAERKKAGEALFWPQSFGAGTIDYGEIVEGQTISKENAEQLAAIAPPLVSLPLDIDGHKVNLITIFEIKPLIANADTKQAYFPLTVGLAIQAGEAESVDERWLEQPWVCLEKWDDSDRQAIWPWLYQMIEATLAELGPKSPPEMEEAVLSVNAVLKVVGPKGDGAMMQKAIASLTANLQAVGNIAKLEITHGGRPGTDPAMRQHLETLVAAVQSPRNHNEKGKALESLVTALFESVTEFDVTSREKTQTEEIDLWITNNFDAGPFRREGGVIIVECKNWRGKCGKNEYVSLRAKMANRGSRCTLGFLVSWNGFADTVTKEMLRASQDHSRIVPLDGKWLREAVSSDNFKGMLIEAYQRSLMI